MDEAETSTIDDIDHKSDIVAQHDEVEDDGKRYCVCANCLTVHYWTQEEYKNNINCGCGCAVWSHDRDLNEARKMAMWSNRVCGF